MRPLRTPALALVLLSLAAGCAQKDGSVGESATGADPTLVLQQYQDVVAPTASDCTGAGAMEWGPTEFATPDGAAWARIEGTFAGGRVGLNVADEGGRRVGFGAGSSPVVVLVEELRASKLVVRAYACEGTPQTDVRVYATFRTAAP